MFKKKVMKIKEKENKITNLPIKGFYINTFNELYIQVDETKMFQKLLNQIIFIEMNNYSIYGKLTNFKLSGIVLKDWVILNKA